MTARSTSTTISSDAGEAAGTVVMGAACGVRLGDATPDAHATVVAAGTRPGVGQPAPPGPPPQRPPPAIHAVFHGGNGPNDSTGNNVVVVVDVVDVDVVGATVVVESTSLDGGSLLSTGSDPAGSEPGGSEPGGSDPGGSVDGGSVTGGTDVLVVVVVVVVAGAVVVGGGSNGGINGGGVVGGLAATATPLTAHNPHAASTPTSTRRCGAERERRRRLIAPARTNRQATAPTSR